ncbi:MAG TPA: SDR family oxidoreductase [Actinomycetota bacterium]|nr:SDR family oxidoreductase [Actinomycetota bacterium]
MSVIAVTGVAGYLGRRVLELLESDDDVQRVVGADSEEPIAGSPKLEFHLLDVRDARLGKIFVGVDCVVHLAFQHDPIRDEERMRSVNVEGTANVLEAAAATGVRKVIYPSSATVYGAHADNDFPLTETSPLRANLDFAFAAHKLETERLLERFKTEHPDIVVTVFRTATVFGPNVENFVSRLMEAPRITTVRGYEPPLQLVHEDDVASAIVLAVSKDLDGVYNLAADGWLSSDEVVALSGKKRVELPEAVAFSMAERLWKTGLTTAPPGELHYVMHPWVVDASKLRAAGWAPRHTNREALLETLESHRNWISVGRARVRKDSLAKGAAATLGAVGAMALVRRARKRSGS